MKLTRLDLDGAGSPSALVTRILELEPDMPIPVPIEEVCRLLDITEIKDMQTEGFEAALITDAAKSSGAILVANGKSPQRKRFSIAHELGHFLIPAHRIPADGILQCTATQLKLIETRHVDFRARMEVEANRFAALLLIPPPLLRAQMRQIREPQVGDIIRLAAHYDVSKDAMARCFVEYAGHSLAVIVLRHGKVDRFYRNERTFPWLAIQRGDPVPRESIWHQRTLMPGDCTDREECEPETWLSASDAKEVDILIEQALGQKEGFGLILLHAELREDDDDGLEATDTRWR